jgi:hypothetical protein
LVSALFEVSEATAATGQRGRLLAQHMPPSWHAAHGGSDTGTSGVDGGMGSETLARLFTVGGLAGVVETFIVQPLVYWKTMSQVAPESLFSLRSLRPNVVYRGVLVNAASIGPISAFQYASNAAFTTLVVNAGAALGGGSSNLSPSQGLLVAATTGAASALVVTPAELVMISQQTTSRSFTQTVTMGVAYLSHTHMHPRRSQSMHTPHQRSRAGVAPLLINPNLE